ACAVGGGPAAVGVVRRGCRGWAAGDLSCGLERRARLTGGWLGRRLAGGGAMVRVGRRRAAVRPARGAPAALLLPVVVAADAQHASDPAEAALSRTQMTHAVAALGPEGSADREVWQLMYVEDRPVAEVAELMGVPEGTVKSRAHRVGPPLRR